MRSTVLCAILGTAFALHMSEIESKPPKFNLMGKAGVANPEVAVLSPKQHYGPAPDTLLGLNVPAWNEIGFIEEYGKPAINSSFNSIRFPGGSWANKYIWNEDWEEYPYFKDMLVKIPHKINTSQAVELAKSTNSQLLIQVNYAVARVYGPEKAGKLAADWVRYIRHNLSYPLAYIEVGNENYGKWEVPFSSGPKHHKVDGKLYGDDFNVIQKHIKEVSPDIQVGAVLSINSGIESGDMAKQMNEIENWNGEVLARTAKKADFVTVHSYVADEKHPLNLFKLAGFGPKKIRTMVDHQIQHYAPKRKERMPIALTEFNIQMPPRDQTVNMVNGLFLARLLGECMEHGIFMTQLWALRSKWVARPAHDRVLMVGKKRVVQHIEARGGEYGIFSGNQPGVTKHTPRATLYTEFIFKKVFSQGRRLVKATSDADDLLVYAAAKEGSETTGMVLVNLGPQTKSVGLDGIPKSKMVQTWALEGENNRIDDRRYMLNLVKTSNSTAEFGGPWPLQEIQPIMSESNQRITVRPYSVVGVLAEE